MSEIDPPGSGTLPCYNIPKVVSEAGLAIILFIPNMS
jgi:hypothetical protein